MLWCLTFIIRRERMLKKLSLLVVSCVFVLSINAAVLIEPYLGYQMMGDYNDGEMDYSGVLTGARVGGQLLGLQAGIDYSMSSPEYENSITGSKSNVDNTYLGVFVGYKLPILARVWGTYIFKHELKMESGHTLSGSGVAFGVSFSPIPIPIPFVGLNFNLEYRSLTYDEATYPGTIDEEATEVVLSVSAPISI